MSIPEQFLEELTARTDIVDLVSSYLPLNRKGGNYWACCPFHGEKTPSFSVSPDKQIFHCFGCGKGGGAIRFVQEMENVSFPDAVRMLAGKCGLEVPEEEGDKPYREQRTRILAAVKDAARYYYGVLGTPQGATVAGYLEKRKISPAFAKRFGLGAAPEGWDNLLRFMTGKGYTKAELSDAGLVVAGKTGSFYDKFRDRLMLPVIDLRGDVIGFTSRVMDNEATPKYLNTPETAVFKKRSVLYGMNLAKNSKASSLLLVEGNIDVITLHQAGFDNAVATMGTALTADHARLMARYTKEVVLCYDNDAAGREATERAMTVLKNTDFTVKVLQLPRRLTESGEFVKQDPDDFIKYQGCDAFRALMNGSENQVAYRLGTIKAKYDLTTDENRAAFLQEAAGMIAVLQSPVEREIYAGRAAEAAGISKEAMENEVARQRKKQDYKERRQEERQALSPSAMAQPKQRALRYPNIRTGRAEEGLL
ncbi:MAG: DNA primase, partial [Oscillospiraceae bacterium]